jgi:hypothetical protein
MSSLIPPIPGTETSQPAKREIERHTCGRCGGSGRYPSSCWNGMCLGCQGIGYRMTKRGAKANAYLIRLRSKPVEELTVGMLVREVFGGLNSVRAFGRVVSVERVTEANATSWSVLPDGTKKYFDGYRVELHNEKLGGLITYVEPGKLMRVGQTAEEKIATAKQALDYQDTLTKTGAVRKVRAGKEASL